MLGVVLLPFKSKVSEQSGMKIIPSRKTIKLVGVCLAHLRNSAPQVSFAYQGNTTVLFIVADSVFGGKGNINTKKKVSASDCVDNFVNATYTR